MTLSTLHWKKLLPVAPAVATIVGVLDAIWAAGTAATYYDGSARVPGAGSAWTWSRYQDVGVTEAVYATPPTDPGMTQRVVLAGASGAHAPTMLGPDTWAVDVLLCGINKSSGAWNAWDAAKPFTVGRWSGYWRVCNFPTTVAWVHLLECEEGVVVILEDASGTCAACVLGGLWDPHSTDALDAETDGRRYGMMVGGQGGLSLTFLSSATQFLDHNTGASLAHHAIFLPGGAGLKATARQSLWEAASSATAMVTLSGAPVTLPITCRETATGNWSSRLREVVYCTASRTGRRLVVGGVDKGYVLGASSAADDDAVLLLA